MITFLSSDDVRVNISLLDGGAVAGPPSEGGAVSGPLLLRSRLSETLAQNGQIKAKAVRTNKSEQATRRWDLQMCRRSHSRHKSCLRVQIALHCSFTQQNQSCVFIGPGEGSWTKDPHYQV